MCCFAPPPTKNNTNSIFREILVSFWVPVRGGITDFCGLLAHRSRRECESSKFTPPKQIVFEAISGARVHLGPPGPKMGPWHPPRSPNDPQNVIFYFFQRFSTDFGTTRGHIGDAFGKLQTKISNRATTHQNKIRYVNLSIFDTTNPRAQDHSARMKHRVRYCGHSRKDNH